MKQLVTAERLCLISHTLSMAFGLAGLLLVLPNPEFIVNLSEFGQKVFQWSMAGGGVSYIILGAAAVALYAYRVLGTRLWLTFMVPAVVLSLGSELLGTSTGFPFGHYQYLSGLGYKVAGLVPFTIPLSWFYMGLVCYVLARAGLESIQLPTWVRQIGAIAVGALLLTAWDFVLDPAMSQTQFPFWQFQEEGAFFGMPYRNLTGWMGTGAIFMTVAAFFWGKAPIRLSRSQLGLPLITYIVNFAFGAIITLVALDSRFVIPTLLSMVLGVVPAVVLWWIASPLEEAETEMAIEPLPANTLSQVSLPPVEVAAK
jgi:putative membrane protein